MKLTYVKKIIDKDKSSNVSNLKKSKNLVSSDVIYVLCCRCAKNTQKGSAKLYIPPLFP